MSLFFFNILTILILLLSVILRETVRAYVSYLLGDKTPAILGRLSLDPFQYFNKEDLMLPLILAIFGYPIIVMPRVIPINYGSLKNPRKDGILINLSSLMTNFIISFIMLFILTNFNLGNFGELIYTFARINMFLFVLNLIPLFPFDGGQLFSLIFKLRNMYINPFFMNIMIIFLILSGILSKISSTILSYMYWVLG